VILGRLSIVAAVIPFFIARIEILQVPLLLTAAMLFLTLNRGLMSKMLKAFGRAHYWLKLQYFWFIVAFGVMFFFFLTNLLPLIASYYFIGLSYLLIYMIWFNKINTMMSGGERIILKAETTEQSSSMDFEPYLIPIIFMLIIVFLISALQSMILSRADSIFVKETFYWYFPIVVLIVHYVIDLLFVSQIEWNPASGTTTWKPLTLDMNLPDPTQPHLLADYFDAASKLRSPPDELADYIEDNFSFLISHALDLSYFRFQMNYVQAVENWGREARDHIHLVLAIVLASVSQYRFIGLIPIYKRKMFYRSLQAIAMTGSMTIKWRQIIEYEVLGKKDRNFVLDWILGNRYLDLKYDPVWLISWEGIIYKGKAGYYEAVHKIDQILQIRPEMDDWAVDIWNLCYEYAKIFVGENSRKILSENVKFYDQLLFLSDHRTTEEYYQMKDKYQAELLNPKNRLVQVTESHPKRELDPDEKRQLINSYLQAESQTYDAISLGQTVLNLKNRVINRIRDLNVRDFIKFVGLLVIFIINLLVVIFLDRFIFPKLQLGILVVALEIIILFILSITPSNAEIRADEQLQNQSQILSVRTYTQSALGVNTTSIKEGLFFLLYGFALLLSYRYFLR